jgi:hypothetical protein
MRITLVYIQVRCEQPERPEENVSRYTVRPGTLGLTLGKFFLSSLADMEDDSLTFIQGNLPPHTIGVRILFTVRTPGSYRIVYI